MGACILKIEFYFKIFAILLNALFSNLRVKKLIIFKIRIKIKFNLWLGFDAINECVYATKKIIELNNLFSNINKKFSK